MRIVQNNKHNFITIILSYIMLLNITEAKKNKESIFNAK